MRHSNRNLLALIGGAILLLAAGRPSLAQSANLDVVLNQTSKRVSAYLDEVSDVKCTEEVSQLKLAPNGKIQYSETADYDYFILLQGTNEDFLLSESRIPEHHDEVKNRNTPLLLTNGFSTLFLVFHPYYRSSFQFALEGEEVTDGQRLVRVHFTHLKGRRTPAALAVRGREYPLELEGTAWIDPATGTITRIKSTIGADMTDVGLKSLVADVDFAPVHLAGWSQDYRFPSVATIDVETLRQHWRNIHRFTHYQRFDVDTQEKISTDKIEQK